MFLLISQLGQLFSIKIGQLNKALGMEILTAGGNGMI